MKNHTLLLAIVGLIVITSYPFLTQASTWLGESLSKELFNQSKSQIAVIGNTVHAVFEDDNFDQGKNRDIVYMRSTDGGDTWTTPVRITEDDADQRDPDIAAYGDYVYIVWEDLRNAAPDCARCPATGSDIYIRCSKDSGDSWEFAQKLTSDKANQWDPKIAADLEYVHVTWLDERNMENANYDIYYRRSTTSGRNWDSEQRLTSNPSIQWRQSIATSGDYVYVVYEDYSEWHYPAGSSKGVIIHYVRSTDAGKSWSIDNQLQTDGAWQFYPDVAASDKYVYLVYQDGRNFGKSKSDLWLIRSEDYGETWSNETIVVSDPNMQEQPKIAVTDQNIHLIWQDYRNMKTAGMDIYYTEGKSLGTEWSDQEKLTDNEWQYQPAIAASNAQVHVLWTDDILLETNGQEIFHISK